MRHVIFILFSPNEQHWGGGDALILFIVFYFPSLADHEWDWSPCKIVFRVGNQYAECKKQQQHAPKGLKPRYYVFLHHDIGNFSAENVCTVLMFPREVLNISAFSSLSSCLCVRRVVMMLVNRGILCCKLQNVQGRRHIHGQRRFSVTGISSDGECQNHETAKDT